MKKKASIDPESRFFDALKEVFIGAEVEGESGYINLMRIKSKYFDHVFRYLRKEINEKTREFPEFREELYDKLYSFFRRYFSESGSIYYRRTPFNERIYERVYTSDRDVVMFWKTHMLYYVKTDLLLRSMEVTIDGLKFYFDVSKLQHRKAWEKRELVYELKGVRPDGTIVFTVQYSERQRKTKVKEILRELRRKGISVDEEVLERAFRVFRKQNEIDYFINKNARQFLREQFDLWLYQYVMSDEAWFTEKRIRQLKVLKDIAYKIIDFIAQFEDELVRIWRKPKFALNSNYVITLDRIWNREGGPAAIRRIIERLVDQKREFDENLEKWRKIRSKYKSYRERFENAGRIGNQIAEWYLLDLVDEDFNPKHLLVRTVIGEEELNGKYRFLPVDTKYFKELEPEILALFDSLDDELDGWLIKSENWQALNTILPKFRGKVQSIYIDPPFNTGSNEFTMYINRFLDSAWITMMENRLALAREFLRDTGSIFVRIDYHGNHYVRFLLDEIFGKENFRNEIIVRRVNYQGTNVQKRFNPAHETIYFYSKNSDKILFNLVFRPRGRQARWVNAVSPKENKEKTVIIIAGRRFVAPKGHHWRFSQEKFDKLYKEGRIRIKEDYEYIDVYGNKQKGIPQYLESETTPVDSLFTDIPSYSFNWSFTTENSEQLLKRIILASTSPGDIVMDFFLGSGTTTAVAHKLGRKWIGIEMGQQFYTVILPRMKKVLAYDKTGISKDQDVKKIYNEKRAGGFFKYYELEQYEDTLRRVRYLEDEPFFDPTREPYDQYIFMKDPKLLEALEIDYKEDKVKVDLEKLYKNIDLPETLSNLLGKKIQKITRDYVMFENEKVDIRNIDYKLIRPLIWW